MNTDNAWIETFTGKKFHLLDPQPEEVCIEDIAHALALSCRFCGHVRQFYSVAEHSIHVSNICEPVDALWGLLHDASEAYIADLSRPVKHCTPVGPPYIAVEARIMAVIAAKFGLPTTMPPGVKVADNTLLFAEKDKLMSGVAWDNKWGHNESSKTCICRRCGERPCTPADCRQYNHRCARCTYKMPSQIGRASCRERV